MANYTQIGSRVVIGKEADSTVHSKLPPGTYTIHHSDVTGFYLETIADFTLPDKVYGNIAQQAERILTTFNDRPQSTGVHLSGIKGSGKTLLVKAVVRLARLAFDIPTIVINQPYHGDEFNAFIQSIDCQCVIVFDEFEKTYDYRVQQKALTLFDGVYPSRKLFILTTNNAQECSEYINNRPGRMYYSITYDVLDAATIREVLEDQLDNKDHIASIVKYAEVFTFLNFDMLIAIIEEMNRYNEDLENTLVMLNVQPEMSQNDKYDVAVTCDGGNLVQIESTYSYDPHNWGTWLESDTINRVTGSMSDTGSAGEGDDLSLSDDLHNALLRGAEIGRDVRVRPQDLVDFDHRGGVFTYNVTAGDHVLVITVTRDQQNVHSSRVLTNIYKDTI